MSKLLGKKWHLLISPPGSGSYNMAVDEYLMGSYKGKDEDSPVLRFYTWQQPTVSIGYFQSLEKEIDVEACQERGIGIVKRITGGRAILHHRELTYSVIIGQSLLPGSVTETYKIITGALIAGLRKLGLETAISTETWKNNLGEKKRGKPSPICFDTAERADLATLKGKKIIGSAQVRKNGVILQHGSIPIYSALETLITITKASPEDKKRLRETLQKKATSLVEEGFYNNEDPKNWQKHLPALQDALIKGFQETFDARFRDKGTFLLSRTARAVSPD